MFFKITLEMPDISGLKIETARPKEQPRIMIPPFVPSIPVDESPLDITQIIIKADIIEPVDITRYAESLPQVNQHPKTIGLRLTLGSNRISMSRLPR